MPPLTSRRLALSIGALLAALALSVAVCASLGSSRYTLLDLLRHAADEETAQAMILRVRLPRILMAALAGAALGAAGAVFQAVLRNPLADPYILGVSGGAALGAFAATALGLPAIVRVLPVREAAAFLGAIATVAVLFVLSRTLGRGGPPPMLLIGVLSMMVPHWAGLMFGPDHRLLVPASALTGAIFLIFADTLARTVMAPTEIPVGVVTALCGGPFFLWLYRRQAGGGYFQ